MDESPPMGDQSILMKKGTWVACACCTMKALSDVNCRHSWRHCTGDSSTLLLSISGHSDADWMSKSLSGVDFAPGEWESLLRTPICSAKLCIPSSITAYSAYTAFMALLKSWIFLRSSIRFWDWIKDTELPWDRELAMHLSLFAHCWEVPFGNSNRVIAQTST